MKPWNKSRIMSFCPSRRVRAFWRCLLTVVVVASAPVAQDVRDPGPGEWLAELLASLNSGDFNRISEFSGEAGWNPAYLWSLHQEFGPLAFGLRAGNAYWCHGELTKAWVGLVVEGRGSRYRLAGVRRGIYPAGRPVADPVAANELADYLQGYLESNSTRNHFSGAVLVAKNGEVLFRGAYGLANRGLGVRNTVDTRFQLASITKMFIGVAISQLVERGELSFSDPIRKFIPEYPQHIAEQVTVHHLLTHTSGIEIDDYPPYNQAVRQAESIEELLAAQVRYIEHLNLGNYDDFEPLDRFDYTNEGVDLLGVIIERVSGLGWEEYLHEHVFSPAGMRDTGLTSGDTHVENLAVGYSLRTADLRGRVAGPRREVRPGTALGNAARPAGSGYSTIADMMRFVGALRNEELLTAEYWATMTKPHIESPLRIPGFERSYGYTIDIKVIDGVRAIGHSGGAPGMSTMLDIYPEHGYLVLVLSNFDNSSARNVSLHIREVLGIPANER